MIGGSDPLSADEDPCASGALQQRIVRCRADTWIGYGRAMALLQHLEDLLGWPRNSRMPSLLVIGEPGIGKTQINAKFGRDHPPQFDADRGRRVMPVVSVQVPAATSDRLFWTALLRAVDAVFPPRLGIAELMFMVLRIYRDVGVRMILFDEAHNMLSGSPREQRRILTHLRYLSNELRVTLVCFGTVAAREAIASDPQLARRFGQYELPAWQADGDFESLVATALHHMPLTRPSVLDPSDLRTIVGATRGNTARVFQMLGDLSVRAIVSGEERVTPEMVAAWRPSIFDRDIAF